MAYNKEELLNLPVEEKPELVEALWDRIDDDMLVDSLAKKNIEEELDRRLNEIAKHPDRVISWEEVKGKMKNV